MSTVLDSLLPRPGSAPDRLADAPCLTPAAKRQRGAQQRQAKAQSLLSSTALLRMQETERKRIATDLHDSIGQSLSALSCVINKGLVGISQGRTQVAGEMLGWAAVQVKAAILEIQRIAMDLRPAILDDIGLIATLTWFFREYRTLHPDLALLSEIGLEEAEVARSLRSHIFRIVQEALNNVIKHAHASEVLVRLWRTKRELHLEVADNGSGFEFRHDELALTDRYALGLSGMRERAEITGGCFRIVSVPGKGTRICVVWPLLLP